MGILNTPEQEEAEDMLNQLSEIIDNGGNLDEFQRGVYETLSWLLDGMGKPNTD